MWCKVKRTRGVGERARGVVEDVLPQDGVEARGEDKLPRLLFR